MSSAAKFPTMGPRDVLDRAAEIVKAWFAAKEKPQEELPIDDQIGRATEAGRLLAHPLMKETIQIIEGEYLKAWFATKDGQAQERERIWMYLKMLSRMQADLDATMRNGEFLKKRIVAERASAERGHGIA